MNSCVYHGTVRHRRLEPVPHVFAYRLFMMYLDLEELPTIFDRYWLWSARRPAPIWFRRADYLGNPAVPLDDAVRDAAETRTGRRPEGPIRMLTQLRHFGFVMNPVTFYYCFDKDGQRIDTVLTEITNTPWNERHTYALSPAPGEQLDAVHPFRFDRAFHVSPFMAMDHTYEWRFSAPDDHLVVHMENHTARGKVFDATLTLTREAVSSPVLARTILRHPLMTAKVLGGIYLQALRLWLKRTPFHVHPAKRST